ncbi:hypothetical protein MKJ04_13660 [Pontibacter sp. E15-1]|uniref:hypothetical protein n=1 Tax=Pontibacter sp. E15-1 TaxID=2919918 RepID=UPI001F4F1F85|nr:hypothetical protein [Pontibacter sp. E15-1]MCJ8165893.1 hypothetical protein [Pontibacter sp. E15-1]
MYTAYIGKRLIELYNKREQTQHNASSFYKEVYYQLFFDDDRFLQHVNNSKFDQAYKQKKKTPLTAAIRAQALEAQLVRIENDMPDGSFYLGGAAADSTAGTSGQVNSLAIEIPAEDVYASWIGAALGIGVNGGLNLLVDSDAVILALLDGWHWYREYMKQTPSLKPHQINTWNGWWLTNAFGSRFNPDSPFTMRQPTVDTKEGVISLKTQPWIQVIFALAQKLEKPTTAYVYSMSQMNTTLGFVQLQLHEIKHEIDLYNKLVGEISGLDNIKSISEIYETQFGFERACLQGAIGLRAVEPAKLREYMPGFKGPAKSFKHVQENQLFKIYEIWIIAMLNNEQLLQKAQDLAEALNFFSQGERGKKTNAQLVSNFLNSSSRRELVIHATKLVEESNESAQQIDEACDELVKLPKQDFPLFMALLRLKYAVAEAKQTV